MFVLKVPSWFKAHLFCQTHFGIKATLSNYNSTILGKGQNKSKCINILTRHFNLTCLKAKIKKIEPFCHMSCPSFRQVLKMSDGFTASWL